MFQQMSFTCWEFFVCDNVNSDKLWEVMDNKIPNYLLNTIKFIYRNTKVRI